MSVLKVETEPLATMFNNMVDEISKVPTPPEIVSAVDVRMTLRMSHKKGSGLIWTKSSDSSITIELATRIQRSKVEVVQ
ncbi:MAG: hypothetical protein AAGI37_14745 [Planctomycetota bacterium]